ncbi:unnamed protein product [Prorocentrum cordatum]|uniref:Ion transport domain-containing protein n=1 Tax=Prorocentrum cordatum TaxID=2364126 RepID=A0ABN9VPR6_9DINO|nr:unnamed protein product [Polarella glacialis]
MVRFTGPGGEGDAGGREPMLPSTPQSGDLERGIPRLQRMSLLLMGRKAEAKCCARYPSWMLIDSEESRRLHLWEMYIVSLLVIVTVTAPFETAFIERDPVVDAWFLFNFFMQRCFVLC